MTDYGVTRAGFTTKYYSDILDSFKAQIIEKYGNDLDLSITSPLLQLLQTIAYENAEMWQVLEDVYHSRYIDYADNTALDNLGNTLGYRRLDATPATGMVKVYRQREDKYNGQYNTTKLVYIPTGTKFSNDTGSITFTAVDDSYISIGDEWVNVPITCDEVGKVGNVLGEAREQMLTEGAICKIVTDLTNPYVDKVGTIFQIVNTAYVSQTNTVTATLRVYRKTGSTGDIIIKRYYATEPSQLEYNMIFRNILIEESWYDDEQYLYFYNPYYQFQAVGALAFIPEDESYADIQVECTNVFNVDNILTMLSRDAIGYKWYSTRGTIRDMVSTVTGTGKVVQEFDFVSGKDAETDQEFRYRIKYAKNEKSSTLSALKRKLELLTNVVVSFNIKEELLGFTGNDELSIPAYENQAAGRGLFAGGVTNIGAGTRSSAIDYVTIATSGNAANFGDLSSARGNTAACGSPTIGVISGGSSSNFADSITNLIEYVTIATAGNTTTFGNLSAARASNAGCSNSVRGIFGGGFYAHLAEYTLLNTIEYITFSTTGSLTDFGDLTIHRILLGSCGSYTKGFFAGGLDGNGYSNVIDNISYSTAGNATDYGDLVAGKSGGAGSSSSVKGVFAGGENSGIVESFIFSTSGNSSSFGSLTVNRGIVAGCSNAVRGVYGGGYTSSLSNVMDYVTFAALSSASSFGSLTSAREYISGCSNCHGGIRPSDIPTTVSTNRALFGGGYTNSAQSVLSYISLATLCNAASFGDLTVARYTLGSCSSATRSIFAGGSTGTAINIIDFVNFATASTASSFGNLTNACFGLAGCSNDVRGLLGGGFQNSGSKNTSIDYITMATESDALDFGDLTVARFTLAACSSATRGVFGGGMTTTYNNTIDYVTIATSGNAADMGDLTVARYRLGACSSPTRGIFTGGHSSGSANETVIDYITLSSSSNAADFGDLTVGREYTTSTSSSTRGVTGGGGDSGSQVNVIDYVTITSLSNASDFGDLTSSTGKLTSCSDGHIESDQSSSQTTTNIPAIVIEVLRRDNPPLATNTYLLKETIDSCKAAGSIYILRDMVSKGFYISVTIVWQDLSANDALLNVKQSLTDYFMTLSAGVSVEYSNVAEIIYDTPGVDKITDLVIMKVDEYGVPDNGSKIEKFGEHLTVDSDEKPILYPGNISITVLNTGG